MAERTVQVPVHLANLDFLLREAELEWLRYRQQDDRRYGAVPLESIQGGLTLVGYALDSVLDEYR